MPVDEGNDAAIAEAAADAWQFVAEEIADAEAWLLDPVSKVTRTAMVGRLKELGGVVLRGMLEAVSASDFRLREARQAAVDECEEVLGSENGRVGVRERYATALRILEDARIDEGNLVDAARHADPLAFMRKKRGVGRNQTGGGI